jgi:beta-lactamase class A
MSGMDDPQRRMDEVAARFAAAACEATLHVSALEGDGAIGLNAEKPMVMASTVKPLVALEVFARIAEGSIDPGRRFRIEPRQATAGGAGLATFRFPVEISVADLASLMLNISDNTATDFLIALVGLDAIRRMAAKLGLADTLIVSDLKTMWDGIGAELGFASYAELLAARSGALGEAARARATNQVEIDKCSVIDPARTTRSTAGDMTNFLSQVWRGGAAAPEACEMLRQVMRDQVARRMERAVPDGGDLAAKSGSLFGRVRNEIGVITYPDARRYAFAVFTRAQRPFSDAAEIDAAMADGVRAAIEALREG